MIRACTKSLFFSANLLFTQVPITPIHKLRTIKATSIQSPKFLLNNNLFNFAQLPKHHVLNMPKLSPTMEEGKILKWNVKEGDQINEGDLICEVETDKATVGFQSTEKGVIAKINKIQGMVQLGTPVVVVTKKPADVSSFKQYVFGGVTKPSETPAPKKQQPKAPETSQQKPATQSSPSAVSYPKHGVLKIPAVSPTMTEGKILEWKIKVGDSFDVGDSLFSIETDKATVDYQATQKGVLAKILNQGTSTLPVGEPVAVFAKNKDDVSKFTDFTLGKSTPASSSPPQTPQAVKTQTKAQNPSQQTVSGERVIASPLAKTLAQQKGFNLSQIQGSGPEGRILKQDVEGYQPKTVEKQTQKTVAQEPTTVTKQQTKTQAPKKPKKLVIPENPFEQIPLSSMRKTIANRLLESKITIPHYYVQLSIEMGKVLELRQQLNKNQEGVKISVNDIIIKAVALALRDVPDANTQWTGNSIKRFKHSDVSVAVATQGGLITPIVFRAQTLGLLDIAKKTKDLAKRARQGKLDPLEFIGGTTTVSNLGMFGIDSVISVINPPQSTILGVGQTKKKVVFDHAATDPKSPYKVVDQMELIVSADHRVVDGALASKWLTRIKKYLQDPVTMLL